MGARGNSGVITSQIFRGMAEAPRRQEAVQRPRPRPRAERRAQRPPTARSPSRSRARSSRSSASRRQARSRRRSTTTTSRPSSAATLEAAEKSVARTPSLLAILREAGVVDSGGQGLYRLFQGALLHLTGKTPVGRRSRTARRPARSRSTLVAHADEGFGYETMFLLRATRPRAARCRRHPRPPRDRSASPCSSPATRGPSRSTSTTSARTSSSATACRSAT